MSKKYILNERPLDIDIETKPVLKQLSQAHQYLAELKGISKTIPNQAILINTLPLLKAKETIELVTQIRELMHNYKQGLRHSFKFYSQDLLNNLFSHPYTKIEFLEKDLGIHRQTASKYLDALVKANFLRLEKIGKHHFYINEALYNLFIN